MAEDPRRLFDAKDIEAAALYANKITAGAEDFYPLKVDANGYLLISMTVGSVSLSSTASTITNAASNPVPVSGSINVATITIGTVTVALTSTEVTVKSAVAGFNVNVATATLGTVTVTGTVTPSTTASTITNDVLNPVNVSLTNTAVTVKSSVGGFNVNVASATLGTVTITGTVTPSTTASTITNAVGNPVNVSLTSTQVTVTNSVSTIGIVGRTLTGSTGSLSATNGTITVTPTNKIKVYAFSLTTTSATEVTCIFHSGSVANGLELWRATFMAPSGTNAGANLAVAPPNFLFASRTGTAVSLSLSTAVLVHYSLSYFEEA